MVRKHPHHIPHFQISQYIVALIMGLVAAWLAPRESSLEPSPKKWRLDEKPGNCASWWSPQGITTSGDRSVYPWVQYWRSSSSEAFWHTLTQDDFRCRGEGSQPPIALEEEGRKIYLFDCWGCDHGLPWFFNKAPCEPAAPFHAEGSAASSPATGGVAMSGWERIPPVLVEILNELQNRLQAPVVILSGHRCLAHHRYITQGEGSPSDKHLIGASVDFYVVGWQSRAREVFQAIDQIQRTRKELMGSKWSPLQEKQMGYWTSAEFDLKYHTEEGKHSLEHAQAPCYYELLACYDYQLCQPIRYSYQQARALPLE